MSDDNDPAFNTVKPKINRNIVSPNMMETTDVVGPFVKAKTKKKKSKK